MSDYYGQATLEDWLAEEVFSCTVVPVRVVALFEEWRETIEASVQEWLDQREYGVGWRQWGCGWPYICDASSERTRFDAAIGLGKQIIAGTAPKNAERVEQMRQCMSAMHTWNMVGDMVSWCRRRSFSVYGWFLNPIKLAGVVVDPRIVLAGDIDTERKLNAAFDEFERLAYETTAEL